GDLVEVGLHCVGAGVVEDREGGARRATPFCGGDHAVLWRQAFRPRARSTVLTEQLNRSASTPRSVSPAAWAARMSRSRTASCTRPSSRSVIPSRLRACPGALRSPPPGSSGSTVQRQFTTALAEPLGSPG